uniref:Transmembrane protein n=1 Tax=Angiostrongylus cantonensis TaxID=6313 RepID=A0A0K0D0Y7_ANGCA
MFHCIIADLLGNLYFKKSLLQPLHVIRFINPSSHFDTFQNGSVPPSYSPYASGVPVRHDRPPLSAPPPPPHPPSSSFGYEQPSYNPMWFDRFPRKENRGIFRLCLVELMLAAVILAGGVWCYRDTSEYCPYYSAIWTSVVYVANSLVGSAAAKIGTVNLYMAHLVLSLVSVMMCFVSGGISARWNWFLVGTYHHPTIERDEAFCLLGQYDTTRISYIFSHMNEYDFAKCLWQLKVGVAVNSVQFVVAAIEGSLLKHELTQIFSSYKH